MLHNFSLFITVLFLNDSFFFLTCLIYLSSTGSLKGPYFSNKEDTLPPAIHSVNTQKQVDSLTAPSRRTMLRWRSCDIRRISSSTAASTRSWNQSNNFNQYFLSNINVLWCPKTETIFWIDATFICWNFSISANKFSIDSKNCLRRISSSTAASTRSWETLNILEISYTQINIWFLFTCDLYSSFNINWHQKDFVLHCRRNLIPNLVWNKIPVCVRESPSLFSFKISFKKFTLFSYVSS